MAVYDYLLEDVSLEERFGVVWRLNRRMIITDLTPSAGDNLLAQAYSDGGVPPAGSSPTEYPALILIGRNAQVHPQDNTKVVINLEYERHGISPESSPGTWFFSGGTSLEQTTTEVDLRQPPINGQHPPLPLVYATLPSDPQDPNSAKVLYDQGGEITYNAPRSAFMAVGILETDSPGLIAETWTQHVNDADWNGSPEGTWMCTNVNFEPFDVGGFLNNPVTTSLYRMTFEFVQKLPTWDPGYWFVNPADGKPAPNGIAGCPCGTIGGENPLPAGSCVPCVEPDMPKGCVDVDPVDFANPCHPCHQPSRRILCDWYPRRNFAEEGFFPPL